MKISELTDGRLVRAVAQEVMGWAEDVDYKYEIYGPEGQFSGIWRLSPDPPLHLDLWVPLTDANHRDMVWNHLVETGHEVIMTEPVGDDFLCEAQVDECSARHQNKGRALMEAALEAVKGGDVL